MREEIDPFAYEVGTGDRITFMDGYTEREGTVLETVDDQLGYGIVVGLDSGREKTIGPEHFEGRV
ncbi:hypothetical protein ACFQO4_20725 [Saliphagus sp. GCM10025334]